MEQKIEGSLISAVEKGQGYINLVLSGRIDEDSHFPNLVELLESENFFV